MISRYEYQGLIWVDLESPTREEALHIMEEFNLPQLVAEELISNTARSKVDLYDELMYVILHFPLMSPRQNHSAVQEIDFVIGKKFIITTRYEAVDPLHKFSKIFEVNSMLGKHAFASHGGIVFMQMIKELYRHSTEELETLTKTLTEIENGIFRGKENNMVRTISLAARRLLDFRQAMRFHKDILSSYEAASKQFFGSEYGYFASAMIAEYNKVYSLLESHRDALSELRKTNDSLLTTKTNEIMKTLTIMTFIMLPLTLITGIFGMNAEFAFIRSFRDFFFIISVMTITGLVMFLFFKIKRWL